MKTYYPIVFERECNGAISAYVPGLPAYAAADTRKGAERAIHAVLEAYLTAHPEASTDAAVKMAKVEISDRRSRPQVAIVGVGALLGRQSSRRKAAASRANGRLGGRPAGSGKR